MSDPLAEITFGSLLELGEADEVSNDRQFSGVPRIAGDDLDGAIALHGDAAGARACDVSRRSTGSRTDIDACVVSDQQRGVA